MGFKNSWGYENYRPLIQREKQGKPFVSRLAPMDSAIEFEWRDCKDSITHTARIRRLGLEWGNEISLETDSGKFCNLDNGIDYEICIFASDNRESDTRIVRPGAIPGIAVNYLHPADTTYDFSGRCLCSPSIVELPSKSLLVSMDVYLHRAPQNLTFIFRSDDRGKTWHHVTDLFPCFWGKLFYHKDAIYMLACSTEYGDLLIGRSEDEGYTWTSPVRILPGSGNFLEGGPHKAPMPIISHKGRLWTAVDYGAWNKQYFASGLASVEENSDLLNPENWSYTDLLCYNSDWKGACVGETAGCLEGNAVVSPNGDLYNILRYQINRCIPSCDKAVILKANDQDPNQSLMFHKVIDFVGSSSKFTIMKDPVTNRYYSLVNRISNKSTPLQRNIITLIVSDNLENWQIVRDILNYDREQVVEKEGLQYVDFIFSGQDILFVLRTSLNGATNYHDSNYITFHVISDFRNLRRDKL